MDNSAILHLITGVVLSVLAFLGYQKIIGPRYCAFALLPILLALEQFSAAIIIISVQYPSLFFLNDFFTLLLVILSQVIWPIAVPFALQRMEATWSIRIVLNFFIYLGIVVALLTTWDIIFYNVEVHVVEDHLYFVQPIRGFFQKFGVYLWITTTVLPAFIAYTRRVWIFGGVLAVAYTYIIYQNHNDFIFFTPLLAVALAVAVYVVLLEVKIEDEGIQLNV